MSPPACRTSLSASSVTEVMRQAFPRFAVRYQGGPRDVTLNLPSSACGQVDTVRADDAQPGVEVKVAARPRSPFA